MSLGSSATAEAAPRLKAAAAVDADNDGSIDGFNLTFSRAVRGAARARGPFAFAVRGYAVVATGRPRGRRVRVNVAEQPGCDLGAKPVVSYRPRGKARLQDMRKRPLPASTIDIGRTDRAAPRITCAITQDADRDGHLDALLLTYSKAIRNRAQAKGPFPFAVDKYSLAAVGRARGRTLTLRVRERAALDTDAVPAVIYRRPAKRSQRSYAVSARGKQARSSTFNATRDRAAALPVSASTEDGDADGLLDGVLMRFSEPVSAREGGFTVEGGKVTAVHGSGRDRISARLAAGPFTTAARPVLTFAGVRDGAGNVTARGTARPDDAAPPVITAARTEDRAGAVGRLDTVVLTFSEQISHAADSDGRYPFGVTGYSIASAGAASGSRVELTLSEGASPDSGTNPPVGYTRGIGERVADAAGNEAVSRAFGGTTDGIGPRLIDASTLDEDLDGRLDAVTFEFSEPVEHAARPCPGCSFSVTRGGLLAESAAAAAGARVKVTVPESSPNTGLRPTASYAPTAGAVTDSSGNLAAAATVPAATDAAPPVAVAAQTADSGGSAANIDRLNVAFSEPLSYPGDSQAPFSLGAYGYQVAGVDPAAGSSLSVRLAETPAPDTGSAPTLSYDGAGGVKLMDAGGVEHARRSYPGLTRDAVAPVLLGATTADSDASPGNLPGRIDASELRYSEQLQGAAGASAFAVAGGRTVTSVAYGPDRVALRFTEATSPDTDATPALSYTPPGAAGDPARLRDIAEGPGDAPDEAGAASAAAADGAKPAIVSARTGDDDADGKLDRVQTTFSEPIAVAAGSGPVLGLTNPGLTVTGVTAPSPTVLSAAVAEQAEPDGDIEPDVTVTAPARVMDLASPANSARTEAFGATADGVRPVLLSAGAGEQAGGECLSAPVDGAIDCVRARWSEPVSPVAGSDAFSLSPFAKSGVLTSAGPQSHTDLIVAQGSTPDRDVPGSLTYAGAGADEVRDLASPANPALDGGVAVARACIDSAASEPNDSRSETNPLLEEPVPLQALCAFDPDWYRIQSTPGGAIEVALDPHSTLRISAQLVDAAGATVPGTTQTSSAPGARIDINATDLAPDTTYWLHVTAPDLQEGEYCLDVTPTPGEECDGGDPLPG